MDGWEEEWSECSFDFSYVSSILGKLDMFPIRSLAVVVWMKYISIHLITVSWPSGLRRVT